jgi:hypothetical protein
VVTKLSDMPQSFMIVDEDIEGMELGFITMALIIDVQFACIPRHCSISMCGKDMRTSTEIEP